MQGNAYAAKDRMPHDRYCTLTFSGDVLSMALPIIGVLGQAHTSRDNLEFAQAFTGAGGVLIATDGIKRYFRDSDLGRRPNGYHSSFPSGHSSSAFFGARLIHKNFGIEYGAPAYALATLTAYSRVQGHYHHTRDVIAGALLAFTVDYLSDQAFDSIRFSPIAVSGDKIKHGVRVPAGIGVRAEYSF